MRQGEKLENEHWEITCADGRIKTLNISTSVLTTDDGQTHVLALMQDITEEERYHKNLENTVKELEKLLPICASCKKIRDDEGYWHQVEAYITKHFDAVFTHGVCLKCDHKMSQDLKCMMAFRPQSKFTCLFDGNETAIRKNKRADRTIDFSPLLLVA